MFFNSWALWEKMSFVLALAILVVFGIAYGKLVWTNRLVKKQERKDEERRIAIEESRQNSQMVETRKSQDIPFGVRAIQSGIQVDGIWISKDATPISASLKLGNMRNNTSDRGGNRSPSPRPSQDSSQAAIPLVSSRGRTTRRESESRSFLADQQTKSIEAQDGRGYRPSYKPRRSSHLRYDSNGEASRNEQAHEQPEGKEAVETERYLTGMDRGPELENDKSSGAAADNERSSGSETDITLPGNAKIRTDDQQQPLLVEYIGGKSLLEVATVASERSAQSYLPAQSLKALYFPISPEPSEHETPDAFAVAMSDTIDTTLPIKPPYARTAPELTASGESQVPLLTHSRSTSPFVRGELHMNKSVRKVNSGFEVLPAGTFGLPSDFGKVLEQEDEIAEKGFSNKLQKKHITSTSSRRPPDNFESL